MNRNSMFRWTAAVLPLVAAAQVASAHLHFGEESPLVGLGGSGTIFFAGCNLRCIYCQNSDISHGGRGRELAAPHLAAAMLKLLQQSSAYAARA